MITKQNEYNQPFQPKNSQNPNRENSESEGTLAVLKDIRAKSPIPQNIAMFSDLDRKEFVQKQPFRLKSRLGFFVIWGKKEMNGESAN
jgi:hypothetical protein